MRTSALIGYKTASELVSKGCFFLIAVYAARTLPPAAFGLFALATTLGWLVSVASDFGLQLHLARAVSQQPGAATAILRRWLWPRVLTAAAAVGVSVPATMALAPRAEAWPFFWIVLAQILSSLAEFLNHLYRGLSRSDVEASLNLAQRLVTLAAVSLLAIRPTLATLALALALPAAVILAVSVVLAVRMAGQATIDAGPAIVQPYGGSASEVWPIGTGIVLSALYFRLDLFFVDYWLGVEAVARYNAVFRLVEATRLFPAAVLAVVFPLLCRATDLARLTRLAGALVAAGAVVAGLLIGPASWLIALFYGPAYADAVPAFRILLLATPLFFLNYAMTHQLIGWERQGTYARVAGAALVANVLLDVALVPRFGIEGAAWATVITELAVTTFCVAAFSRVPGSGRQAWGWTLGAPGSAPRVVR